MQYSKIPEVETKINELSEKNNHHLISENVNEEDIAEVVSNWTHIPVAKLMQGDREKLINLADELRKRVIGQDNAIKLVSDAIIRQRAGIKNENRPIGSFMFLGPTGVGKTQLSKVLAKYLFGSHDSLIRVDMSEYMEKFNVSRLVGAAPGYVGYEEGGQLTEKVRRKPYSIVLFDEIEKAHPDIFNILLQILDEGHITDSLGRKVDFKNTIIIMTSNVGARDITDFNKSVGFSSKSSSEQMTEHSKGIIEKALKKTFAPEFLNRIDDVIQFNSLDKVAISKIIDIELKGLFDRIKEMNYDITISEKAKDYIIENGYDLKFGARPLKRAIQKYVEDPLAEFIISGQATSNMIIDIENDEIVVKNVEKTVSKRKKKDL